ncbi:hypothetical protein F4778DRAFT_194648 [Xylariomycetidae sp. FL2044]|nr:hypothetical protein F4778DRAFT_194648 [Xylariomycetidae sp. FL2044]
MRFQARSLKPVPLDGERDILRRTWPLRVTSNEAHLRKLLRLAIAQHIFKRTASTHGGPLSRIASRLIAENRELADWLPLQHPRSVGTPLAHVSDALERHPGGGPRNRENSAFSLANGTDLENVPLLQQASRARAALRRRHVLLRCSGRAWIQARTGGRCVTPGAGSRSRQCDGGAGTVVDVDVGGLSREGQLCALARRFPIRTCDAWCRQDLDEPVVREAEKPASGGSGGGGGRA